MTKASFGARVFETVGPGSIPGRVTWHFNVPIELFSECAGTHATLRRSKTRFDSWREHLLKFNVEYSKGSKPMRYEHEHNEDHCFRAHE